MRRAVALADDEDATTALNWLVRDYLAQLNARYQAWLDVEAARARAAPVRRGPGPAARRCCTTVTLRPGPGC